jgi:predicted PurR-regulated permease PerM
MSPTVRGVLQVLLIVAAVVAALWMLHRLASLAFVLILAALFAYLVAPLVQLAERPVQIRGRRRRLSRGAAIALVYVLMAGGVSAGVALLLPSATQQVEDLISRAPTYAQSIVAWEHGWSRYYARLRIPVEVRQAIDRSVLAAGAAAVESGRRSLLALAASLAGFPWLVLIPILGFFMLKDAASIRRAIVGTLPSRMQLRVHRLFADLNATLAAYIRAQLLACVLVGTVCGLGFALLGIPYPVVLGVLAGILEFIPFVGPLLLAIVASIVGALHSPMLALSAVAFLAVLRVVEDYVVYPRLVRRSIDLHPFTVIVAVMVGAELDGVAGMFLAVPTVAIASVVYRHWLDWRASEPGDATSLHAGAPALPD